MYGFFLSRKLRFMKKMETDEKKFEKKTFVQKNTCNSPFSFMKSVGFFKHKNHTVWPWKLHN